MIHFIVSFCDNSYLFDNIIVRIDDINKVIFTSEKILDYLYINFLFKGIKSFWNPFKILFELVQKKLRPIIINK